MESKNSEATPVIILILISSLSVFAGSLLAPIESRFINSICNDTRVVGAIFSLGTLLSFFFSIYVGRKSVEWGKKRTTMVGVIAGLIFPIIYATSHNAFQYAAGRAVWAFSSATMGLMINAIFQDMVKKRKNIAELSGYRFSAQSIAGSCGALFSGYVADVYGLRAPYFMLPAVYLLIALLVIRVFREYREEDGAQTPPHNQTMRKSLGDITSNPFLFFRFFTEGITQSHWAMEPIVFPFAIYAMTHSDFYTGLVFSLMGVIAMFALPLSGRFVDKHSAVTGLKIAFTLYCLSFLIMALAPNILVFVTGALLLSLGKTFNGPSIARIETLHIPSKLRGEYLGYFQAYDTLTGAGAAFITGVMLRYLAPKEVIFIYALCTLAGFLAGYLLFLRKLRVWSGKKLS